MDKELAEKTSLMALRLGAMIDKNLREIQDKCPEEEFKTYVKGAGSVMGYLQFEFMNPVYEKYPELMPKELGGMYEIDTSTYNEIYNIITSNTSGKS